MRFILLRNQSIHSCIVYSLEIMQKSLRYYVPSDADKNRQRYVARNISLIRTISR